MARPKTAEYDDGLPEIQRRRNHKPDAGIGRGWMFAIVVILGAVVLAVALGWIPFGEKQWKQEQQRQAEETWKQQVAAASSDQHRAKAFLDYWLALVRLDNLDEAYQRTTGAFRGRTSRAEFDRLIQENSDLKTPQPGWSFGLDGKPGTRFSFVLSRPKTNPYLLTAAKEGGEWKLDEIRIK
jgi:hypothetical protein